MVQPANSPSPADVNDSTFCWSCLQTFTTGQLVNLDHVGTALPVCPACWKQMTVSERVHAANQIMFVSTATELIANVAEFSGIVNDHVKSELGQGAPWWAKGGGKN